MFLATFMVAIALVSAGKLLDHVGARAIDRRARRRGVGRAEGRTLSQRLREVRLRRHVVGGLYFFFF